MQVNFLSNFIKLSNNYNTKSNTLFKFKTLDKDTFEFSGIKNNKTISFGSEKDQSVFDFWYSIRLNDEVG